MKLLPCPFCGGEPEVRFDAPEPRPFLIRCAKPTCPGRTSTSYAEDDVATTHWQCRAQMPPPNPEPVHSLAAFTTRSLMRGEMLWFDLDRTGALTSDALRFTPESKALMLKPREC